MVFVECAAREGENEYHILLYIQIYLILLCEIVLPIIMLKCRLLIILLLLIVVVGVV